MKFDPKIDLIWKPPLERPRLHRIGVNRGFLLQACRWEHNTDRPWVSHYNAGDLTQDLIS